MAIDRTGINSLDAGAPNLRLEGDIASIQAIPIELQKIILQYWIQQGDGSSADRIEDVPKEFRDNIIQLFRQQSSAQGGMEPMSAAQGGRAEFDEGGWGGDGGWNEPESHDFSEDMGSVGETSSPSSNETDSLADLGIATRHPDVPAYDYEWDAYNPSEITTGDTFPGLGNIKGTDLRNVSAENITAAIAAGGDGGNGGDTTNAPVVTGGAAGPTGEVLKRDPYLDPNLMAASIPFETKNLEKLQFGPELDDMARRFGPELDDMARRYVSADGGRIGYGLGNIVRQNRAKFGMPISYNNDEEEDYPWNTDRGRVPAAFGGIMGLDGRRAYGLGSLNPFKAVKKAFKAVKKVAKSPLGKLALGYLATAGLANIGAGGWGTPWGTAQSRGWLHPSIVKSNIAEKWGNIFPGKEPVAKAVSSSNLGVREKVLSDYGISELEFAKLNPVQKEPILNAITSAGGTTAATYSTLAPASLKHAAQPDKFKQLLKWGIPSAMLFSMTPMGQKLGRPEYNPDTMTYEQWLEDVKAWDQKHLAGLKDDAWKLPEELPTELQYAQGGRIGYDEGKLVAGVDTPAIDLEDLPGLLNEFFEVFGRNPTSIDELKRWAVSRETSAQGGRIGAQEGGLMNLGGMEKDYRQEGGFVPIGGQEKADDVPARLSKNEFVFTADAVRAAGGGDIDAGAEVMENVMENLEQGGQVSEESQGLEGARNMFATAQRLGGVI